MYYDADYKEEIRSSIKRIETKLDHLIYNNQTPYSRLLEREYYSVCELSRLLKVSQKTIYNWGYKDNIPYTKINGRLLFARKEMEDFARERTNR